jgi:hypothetical protein
MGASPSVLPDPFLTPLDPPAKGAPAATLLSELQVALRGPLPVRELILMVHSYSVSRVFVYEM